MKTAICHLKSISPYSQSKFYDVPELNKELKDAYERRTWRERLHYDKDENVFIPPLQFCNSLKESAKYANKQIPGKGKSTYTKHFEAGVMVVKPLLLPLKKNDVQSEAVHVPADGTRGGTKRVMKYFPFIPEWEGKVEYLIMDDIITEDVFKEILVISGTLIGIGHFRPRNWGYYGRFDVKKIEWIEN